MNRHGLSSQLEELFAIFYLYPNNLNAYMGACFRRFRQKSNEKWDKDLSFQSDLHRALSVLNRQHFQQEIQAGTAVVCIFAPMVCPKNFSICRVQTFGIEIPLRILSVCAQMLHKRLFGVWIIISKSRIIRPFIPYNVAFFVIIETRVHVHDADPFRHLELVIQNGLIPFV